MELSFPRTFTPGNESSINGTLLPGTFAPGSESDVELSLPGTFFPLNFHSDSQRNMVLLPNTNYDYLIDKLMEIKVL